MEGTFPLENENENESSSFQSEFVEKIGNIIDIICSYKKIFKIVFIIFLILIIMKKVENNDYFDYDIDNNITNDQDSNKNKDNEKIKEKDIDQNNEKDKDKENEKVKEKDIDKNNNEKDKDKENEKENDKNKDKEKDKRKDNEKEKEVKVNDSKECVNLDPILMLKARIKSKPVKICDNKSTKHICYKNSNTNINYQYATRDGVVCTIENFIIDPTKWVKEEEKDNPTNKGAPLLSKGFYNTKCDMIEKINGYGFRYQQYFNAWDYDYKDDIEKIEELAPGKTIFLLSRNNNSPNMFHGGCEVINAVALMDLLNLKPEDIKIIFLESYFMKDDPFYDMYKVLISRGGDPVHIRDIKKKFRVSNAVLIPINWDSPSFLTYSGMPRCSKPSPGYQLLIDLVDKYTNLSFKDNFISYNSSYYYPKSVIDHYKSGKSFRKIVTIQWRRIWPKDRQGQGRLMGNGPEMTDKLASVLPKDILIRLVDTADLNTFEQIAIAKDSDYFIGVHGAGLFLMIFTPSHCINHEILPRSNMNGLRLMSTMSGHKTYSNILGSNSKSIGKNNYIYFDLNEFAKCITQKMKENNFF
jgi:hypothetical protein